MQPLSVELIRARQRRELEVRDVVSVGALWKLFRASASIVLRAGARGVDGVELPAGERRLGDSGCAVATRELDEVVDQATSELVRR